MEKAIKQDSKEKNKAMKILHTIRISEPDAVKRWLTSEEFMKAEQECQRTGEDKKCTGAYELTNQAFWM